MIPLSLASLDDAALAKIGFAEPAAARRTLLTLSGRGITDDAIDDLLPALLSALRSSPDPDRALQNLSRWLAALPNPIPYYQHLRHYPPLLVLFCRICGVSQFFADILIHHPEYIEILETPDLSPARVGQVRPAGDYFRALSVWLERISQHELQVQAMLRFKEREILRIGTRDILNLAPMPATAREFSHLADAIVQTATAEAMRWAQERLRLSAAPVPFTVLGMGKLGGQELNYSSDIDLMFVYGDGESPQAEQAASEYALKVAERIVGTLTKTAAPHHLFRVDMRLRPEGRFGALARSLASYAAYYESWAEPWEIQALLKVRPLAGDAELGTKYLAMIAPYVYRQRLTSDFVDSIRRNKAQIERKAEEAGQAETNVKTGRGGIRDIEFAVQLLQLELAGKNPLLRTPNTLEALARLHHVGILAEREAQELSEDYVFLRNVEHRLQLLYDRQTQTLPAAQEEQRLLARRLDYETLDAFTNDYRRRTVRVNRHFQTLFYGRAEHRDVSGEAGWLTLPETNSREALTAFAEMLRSRGFSEPEQAARTILAAAIGNDYGQSDPQTRAWMPRYLPRLLEACERTGDPDTALLGMATLAASAPNPAQWYHSLTESDLLLPRLCALSAYSLPLVQVLAQHDEWLDLLVGEEILEVGAKSSEAMTLELEARLSGVQEEPAFLDTLAQYLLRERLRIAARDVWGIVPSWLASEELTSLADAALGVMLRMLCGAQKWSNSTVAVLGLGKLGGRELGYRSDWDVLLVTDSADETAFARLGTVAERLLVCGEGLKRRGVELAIDLRLRPEGRFGPLVQSLALLRAYYSESAQTWERQALVKARFVAGDHETGNQAISLFAEAAFGTAGTIGDAARITVLTEDVLHMKRRIEMERLQPAERTQNLKLGSGGLMDIEFLVQLWQMRCGGTMPDVRTNGTVPALYALGRRGIIPAPDAARLAIIYQFLLAVRNRLALRGGDAELLPTESRRLRPLAISLGFVDEAQQTAEVKLNRHYAALTGEARGLLERYFYGLSRETGNSGQVTA